MRYPTVEKLVSSVPRLFAIPRMILYGGKRFLDDDGLRIAASLTYSSLLALVPLLAIGLGVLSAFPIAEGLSREIQRFVFGNFLPETGESVSEYLTQFTENASKMTGPGLMGLAITAVLLLSTINRAFNEIWRVKEPRPVVVQFLVYWAVLTLGPLMLGTSLTLSSTAFAAVQWVGLDSFAAGKALFARFLPFGLSTLGFMVLYLVIPNRSVRTRDALIGGAIAALLFEALKFGFGLYLEHFPSYQAIYGAMATIPIFLLWMYLSWSVVLLGAEIAAGLPEWEASRARGHVNPSPGAHLALALSVLVRLRRAAQEGIRVRESVLAKDLPASPAEVDDTLQRLRRAGYVARTSRGRWILARDLGSVTLGSLVSALRLAYRPGDGWEDEASRTVAALADCSNPVMEKQLEGLLQPAPQDIEPLKFGRPS